MLTAITPLEVPGWVIETSQNAAGALLAEGVRLLRREPDEKAVLLLVFRNELHYIFDGLADGDPSYRSLATKLLGDVTLLLKIRNHHVHNSRVGQSYC